MSAARTGITSAIIVFLVGAAAAFVASQLSLQIALAGIALVSFTMLAGQSQARPRLTHLRLAAAGIWAPPLVSMLGYLYASSGPVPSDYLELRVFEFIGLAIGSVFLFVPYRAGIKRRRLWPSQRRLLLGTYALGTAFGVIFVLLHGSPLLSGQAESARADAGAAFLRIPAHLVLPASLLLFAARDRRRWMWVAGAFLVIAALGNRSPLVYLVGGIVLIEILQRPTATRHASINLRTLLGLGAVVMIVMAGATVRVLLTPEYRYYDEFRRPIAEGDYLEIASVSLFHYAKTVGDNAVLTKALADSGAIPRQYGRSYMMPLATALPGRQETLDLTIKRVSGATFIGGGTPPTLSGEGYANFGWAGSIAGAAALSALVARSFRRFQADQSASATATFAFVVVYACLAQVAGFAGASGVPLLALVALLALGRLGCRGATTTAAHDA